MKSKIVLIILLFSIIRVYPQEIAMVEEIRVKSEILNQERAILIYTSQLYDENTLVNYDVIYVFDSQNREIFDLVHSSIKFIDVDRRYIVVGITSPYYEETDYGRNNDYLPEPKHVERNNFYGGYCCNSANMKQYIMSEVIPYIEVNYRTTKSKICIGHSLSASFAVDFFLTDNLFDAYFCISPNFAYDEEQLATAFIDFDFKKIKDNRFLYLTNANEDWAGWEEAREKVYSFLREDGNIPDNIRVDIKSYPDEDHWYGYLPALTNGLKSYFEYHDSQNHILSEETHSVIIKVTVPDSDDNVFITGNQEALGNWNPSLIEMKQVSEKEREIELNLHTPVELLFTRGGWDSKAIVNKTYANDNIKIDPSTKNTFEFDIIGWFDD